jgi:isopentenyl-diphosphate Delta-isomerase
MADEIVDLVDEFDNIIGEGLKSDCHKKGLGHRAASILVFNKEGKLLVQKRAPNMPRPNLLCSSASGHLQKGDSYEEGAKRELKEELGIECNLKLIGKFIMDVVYPDGKIDKEHYQLFFCNYDGEFKIQKEELSLIKFLYIDEIKEMMQKNKNQFTPGFRQQFQHYLDYKKNS